MHALPAPGLDPVDVQGDFPMELFLLMALKHVGDPELGPRCHAYGVEAERSMHPEVRRTLFRSFAASGVGRSTRPLARKIADDRDARRDVDDDEELSEPRELIGEPLVAAVSGDNLRPIGIEVERVVPVLGVEALA